MKGKADMLTAHRGVHASNINEKREHCKVECKDGGFRHLVLERFSRLGRMQYSFGVEVPEANLLACSITGGRHIWVSKDLMSVVEDILQEIELDIRTSQRLAVSAFNGQDPSWCRTSTSGCGCHERQKGLRIHKEWFCRQQFRIEIRGNKEGYTYETVVGSKK